MDGGRAGSSWVAHSLHITLIASPPPNPQENLLNFKFNQPPTQTTLYYGDTLGGRGGREDIFASNCNFPLY